MTKTTPTNETRQYQESICDSQKTHPDQSENDLISNIRGAIKPINKLINIIAILFSLYWLVFMVGFVVIITKAFHKTLNTQQIEETNATITYALFSITSLISFISCVLYFKIYKLNTFTKVTS